MKSLKISIAVLFVLFLLSFQQEKAKHFVIVAYREPEIMHGNIKQVIELRPAEVNGEAPQLCPFDTTSFDKNGDPIETRLGVKKGRCFLITYKTKYDGHGKKLETMVDDGNKTIYKFNDKGCVIKSEYYTTSMHLLDYSIYKYNSTGEISESSNFPARDGSKPTNTRFEYELKGFLSSSGRRNFQYLSTDANGNWTKRIVSGVNRIDTVTRKITYY